MFVPNWHDKLIERQKTRYTQIPFQEYKISKFYWIVHYFSTFIETIKRCLCSCARLRHTWVSCQNIFRMIFNVRRSFVGFRLHTKVLQSPSQDSILYYKWSDFCATVCDLGTLWSLVRFFSYWLATNCNTITYNMGKLFDFCYIPKTVCSMKEDWRDVG